MYDEKGSYKRAVARVVLGTPLHDAVQASASPKTYVEGSDDALPVPSLNPHILCNADELFAGNYKTNDEGR